MDKATAKELELMKALVSKMRNKELVLQMKNLELKKELERYKEILEIRPTAKPRIYYAHHQWKYGTPVEAYELGLIRSYFPNADIFNPFTDLNVYGRSEEQIMEQCLKEVRAADIVVFSSMDGSVGKGVYTEIETAVQLRKLILYIHQDELTTDWWHSLSDSFHSNDRVYGYIFVRGEGE